MPPNDRYVEFLQQVEGKASPALQLLRPALAVIASQKHVFYWLLFSLPSSIFVFIVTTRVAGELSGDYDLASAFGVCLAFYGFTLSDYIRRRATTVSPGTLKEFRSEAQAPLLEATDKSPGWLNDFAQNQGKGLVSYRLELEQAIKLKLKDAHHVVDGKPGLGRLIEELAKARLCSELVITQLRRIKVPLNCAAHGEEFAEQDAKAIAIVGQSLLDYLRGNQK